MIRITSCWLVGEFFFFLVFSFFTLDCGTSLWLWKNSSEVMLYHSCPLGRAVCTCSLRTVLCVPTGCIATISSVLQFCSKHSCPCRCSVRMHSDSMRHSNPHHRWPPYSSRQSQSDGSVQWAQSEGSWVGWVEPFSSMQPLLPPNSPPPSTTSFLSDTHKHERRCAHAYVHEFERKTWLIRDFLCVCLAESQSTVKGPVCATC